MLRTARLKRLLGSRAAEDAPAAALLSVERDEGTAPADRPAAYTTRHDGVIVHGRDVSFRYPGAIRETLVHHDWASGYAPDRRLITVFPVRDAIVTRCYLVLDPARGWLFRDQSYFEVENLFPLGDLLAGDRFAFRSNDVRHVPGRVAVIGGPIDGNYYHLLLNWLMRLELFRQVSPELYAARDVRFLVDVRWRGEPFLSLLGATGIDHDRIVWSDHVVDYCIDEAILVTLPDQTSYYPALLRSLGDRIRRGLGVRARATDRRIWIDRQGLAPPKRRVHNMAEVAPVLDRFGFERLALERMPLEDQVAAFAQASVVAGVHGAGLANMILCPPTTRVLLVEKPYNEESGLAFMFAVLAAACGLRHDTLIAGVQPVAGVEYSSLFTRHHQDVVIEPDALAHALERLLA